MVAIIITYKLNKRMEKKSIRQIDFYLLQNWGMGMQLPNGAQERAPFSNLSLLKFIYSKQGHKIYELYNNICDHYSRAENKIVYKK